MCSKECEESPHHRDAECRLIDRKIMTRLRPESNPKMYQCISALRCLSLPDRSKLDTLVSHLDHRIGTDIYRLVECNIVGFIRNALKLTQFEPEDIQRVSGILDTNCFDVRLQSGKGSIRGLYPTAALMNHECIPNTRHVINEDNGQMRIRVLATVDIQPGSRISATYTQSLWNTLSRRAHLKACKHFWCACTRCSDPTELGTMLSALKCLNGCDGAVLSTDSLDQNAPWKCTKCHSICYDAKEQHEALRKKLKDLVPQSRIQPESMEEFIRQCYPSSCHVTEAKFALVQLLGNSQNLDYQGLQQFVI